MSAEVVLSSTKGDEQITITPQDLKPSGDWGFRVGEVWSLKNLIKFGLVASSNDAMAAAASALGSSAIDTMNRRAKELGLTNMYFYNPTGLDLDEETAGAYGSVHDVALLAAAFLEQFPAQFEATAATSVSISEGKRTLEAEATAAPLLAIPGLIAAKTGYTDLAGGNLVAAIDMEVGHPVIVAVMGSTVDGRFEDVKLLTTQTHDLFTNHH
jgi:D-alanyl-D-alanine carboxypeptidase